MAVEFNSSGSPPPWLTEVVTFIRAVDAVDLFASHLKRYEQLADPLSQQTAISVLEKLGTRLATCRTASETARLERDALRLSRALGRAIEEWQADR